MDVLWNSCFQACSRLKLFLKSGAMLRWQCSHTLIVPGNGKMKYKVYNIDWNMCFSVWLSFFLFHSLAHYVEAATNRLGFHSPKLSSNQAEMPRTRFVTNLVRLLQGLLILHKSYNIYYFTLLCNNLLHYYVTIFFCTSITEVKGLNPIHAWIFFSGSLFRNCESCVYNCEDLLSYNNLV